VSFSFLTVKSFSQFYFELSVDNDLYFLTDQYYSSGIIISYGKKNENKGNHWRLGQEIYHPSHRYTTNLLKIDYPYSGWLYIQNEKEYFIDPSSSYSWGLEIGITGDASLARTFQNFYHRTFLNLEELTWTAAQPQRFHFGFFGKFNKGISISNKIHFTSQVISKLSSYRIQSIGRLGVLIGTDKTNPFQRVSFNKELSKGLYIGTRQEYRPHDFALSGSIFDNSSSKLTKPNLKYRNSFEFGVFTQKKRWTLLMLYQSMSKDTPGQRFSRHKVLNITIRNQF
tara:strand:- start:1469 stop:2317 length:849 start_codon:yes stop_codon:yes gene_type:complete